MAARPLGPTPVQQPGPVQHAQFQPSGVEQMKGQVLNAGINKGIQKGMGMLFPAATPAAAGAAAAGTAAAGTAAAGTAAAGAAGTAAATGAAGAGLAAGAGAAGAGAAGAGILGGLGGAGAAGAGLMAAAAPVALPLAVGAGLGKLFGLFQEGGRVPSETMTAVAPQQQAPQQQAPQQQTPLSFKQLEQQQSLSLKKQAFDADERRKDEAHQIKMMQQQIKLTEAAGLRTPLSAP